MMSLLAKPEVIKINYLCSLMRLYNINVIELKIQQNKGTLKIVANLTLINRICLSWYTLLLLTLFIVQRRRKNTVILFVISPTEVKEK